MVSEENAYLSSLSEKELLERAMYFNLKHLITRVQLNGQCLLSDLASDLSLLIDTTQLNRRTRLAWQQGRTTRACYLLMDHQRRRITRRREIRRLIEG